MNEPIYIGVIGSRRRDTEEDFQIVKKNVLEVYNIILDGQLKKILPRTEIHLVSGGCKQGADRFCKRIIIEILKYSKLKEHLPKLPDNYDQLPGRQKLWVYAKACYTRNTLIAQDAYSLVACVSEDRTGGTEDTIKKFVKIHKGTRKLVLI